MKCPIDDVLDFEPFFELVKQRQKDLRPDPKDTSAPSEENTTSTTRKRSASEARASDVTKPQKPNKNSKKSRRYTCGKRPSKFDKGVWKKYIEYAGKYKLK